jgi:hypothetical protein
VFVMAPTQGAALFRLKPRLDAQRRHRSHKFTGTELRRQTALAQFAKTVTRALTSECPIPRGVPRRQMQASMAI